MIITIGGNVGAGKTTLATRLSRSLGWEELYMGGLMRAAVAERNLTIETFYTQLKNDPALEKSIDALQIKLMQEKKNVVVQGRVAWFFAKQSQRPCFNIFLMVAPDVGATRTAQRPENIGRDIGKLRVSNEARAKTELERYRTLYGIENFLDHTHYDFVLDTTHLTEEEVLRKILETLKARFGTMSI